MNAVGGLGQRVARRTDFVEQARGGFRRQPKAPRRESGLRPLVWGADTAYLGTGGSGGMGRRRSTRSA